MSMTIGAPVTNKFQIGNAEIRIGALTNAGKLTPAHSVGLLESATVNYNQESVDLEGGLPKTLIDTVITRTNVTVDAQAYEYSRRNIQSMINLPQDVSAPSEYNGTVAVAYNVGATSTEHIETNILLTDVNVGDVVLVYPVNEPQKVSLIQVTAKAARTAPDTTMARITFDATKTPMLFSAPVGSVVVKTNTLGLGGSYKTNYFTLDVIGLEHTTGRPKGFRFWKCAVAGGMQYSFSNDNYAVTPMQFKVLQPPATDTGSGGDLEHVAALVANHPYGMFFGG